mmetsp:Transcript_18678/g.44474  ORF Transcript_18678/g.44474 Transcript_18678/m.44474 type:complete len:947 (-) Transcript_18678:116-2956(-)|eukprot:CAMPEP_0177705342 /NCGR_PEP_ID=MMETSP0484_2-20121128/8657_1 /TAXON_ID=354590 /ORGANISM="Rhodomonas lens, Strain RHODO" /LENGTH=946 /DNA_ID=CAMNT_0019216763 /DNA_START=306 /DNA_END=3146 /DNA_ORIENTATION=-
MAGTEAAQAEQVWRMVQSLYHAHNEEERKAADNWLKDFQRSPAAWSILDQLLKADGVTEETQFFAANSLRSKINHRDLSQLDSAGRDSLAGSLMAHIHKFRNGPMVVRTQLCLTFSAYAAQFDRTQNNIVQDVCNSLGASPDTVPVLLELLTLLGEEAYRVQEDFFDLPPDDQHPLLLSARASALPVLNFLHQCFGGQDAGGAQKKEIMMAFCRWLRFGAVAPAEIVQSPIVQQALPALKDDKLCEVASDLVCELAFISKDLSQGMPIFQLLTSHLQTFYELYQSALQKDDDILARAVTRIVTEMGENYMMVIAEASPDAVSMVNLLVMCSSHSDTNIASITYVFWWKLNLALKDSPDESVRAQRVNALQGCLQQMVVTLARSAMYPDDVADFDQAQEEEFKNFRLETLYDAILDICEALGGQRSLQTIFPVLVEHVEASKTNPDKWREVEGCLFCVRAFARYVPANDTTVTQQILALYDKFSDHFRIRQCFTIVISKFGRWINEHGDLLGPLLNYVVQGLGMPKVGRLAAEALQDLCQCCAVHMAAPAQLNGLLQIYTNMNALDISDQERIIEGLGTVLVRVQDGQLGQMLEAVAATPIQQAVTSLQQHNKPELVKQLKKIRTLIKGGVLACENSGAEAQRELLAVAWAEQFQKVWPVLEQTMVAYGVDEELMEDVCRIIKSAIQAMGVRFEVFLAPFATTAVNAFIAHPLSCILYAVTTLVGFFGRMKHMVPPLLQMLEALSGRTLTVLQGNDAFSHAPDIVTEYFELIGRGLRRFPQEVWAGQLVINAFQCALASLYTELAHREALQAVLRFLDLLVLADANDSNTEQYQRDRQLAASFLVSQGPGHGGATLPHGAHMVKALLHAICTKSSVCIEPVSLAMIDLARLLPQQTSEWGSGAMQEIPDTVVFSGAKSAFLRDFQGATDLKGMKQAMRGLHRAARPA